MILDIKSLEYTGGLLFIKQKRKILVYKLCNLKLIVNNAEINNSFESLDESYVV